MKNHEQFKAELYRRRDEKLRGRATRHRLLTACVSMVLVIVMVVGYAYTPMLIGSPELIDAPERNPVIVHAADLMEHISIPESGVEGKAPDDRFLHSQMDFSLKLFQQCIGEDNALISPLSVSLALAMTANGADSDTLADMEKALGGLSIEDLNSYLSYYVNQLPSTQNTKVSIANSLWFKNNKAQFTPKQRFLETALRYYGADAYAAPFDATTLDDINSWVSKRTDGMIDQLLENMDPYAVMYLINTLLFDAKWAEPYFENSVREEPFTNASGKEQTVEMMRSEERLYLEDANAIGMVKDYEGGYRFVALLPKEGMTVAEYVRTLTADGLLEMLSRPKSGTVFAALPKFQYEDSHNLNKALSNMGMASAFYEDANFTRMGTTDTGKLFIGRVIHKTRIAVDMGGTKAGAATAVEIVRATGALVNTIHVTLDRPFVYLIIDSQTNLPLFMGTVTDLG